MLCHAEICRWEKGLLRTQTSTPFIGDLPGPHLLWPRRGDAFGECQSEIPDPDCRLQTTSPRRANLLWLASKPGRGLSAWWGPQRKMEGKQLLKLRSPPMVPGESKMGALPLFGQGFGGRRPRGKGWAGTPVVFGRLGPGGRPTLQGAFPWSVPP